MDTLEYKNAFEKCVNHDSVKKHVNFLLGCMEVNGQFHHYMDSDTDSTFIGFKLSYLYKQRNP